MNRASRKVIANGEGDVGVADAFSTSLLIKGKTIWVGCGIAVGARRNRIQSDAARQLLVVVAEVIDELAVLDLIVRVHEEEIVLRRC